MNRRTTIVGLDLFVLLSLPILLSGRPSQDLRPNMPGSLPAYLSRAYRNQADRDYQLWYHAQLHQARESADGLRKRLAARMAQQNEMAHLADELAKERKRISDGDRQRERLKEHLDRARQAEEALKRRVEELNRHLDQQRNLASRIQAEKAKLQTELGKRPLAESSGRVAEIARTARGKLGRVTGEIRRIGSTDALRSKGPATPVQLGGKVRLIAHVSALGLTSDALAGRPGEPPPKLASFASHLLGPDGQPDWVTQMQFFRDEQRLAILETERGSWANAPAFRTASSKFMLGETVVVLAQDDIHFEGRFSVRDGYLKLAAFRSMRFRARWIPTSQQCPSAPGDLVLDHEGGLIGILVTKTVAYVLTPDARLDEPFVLPPLLRTSTDDPARPEKQRLILVAQELNKWIHAQEWLGRPFKD